ncbi:nuclear autoantigenic sperm protein isoform X3 [Colossoma macropomum]|uniref:nuclear autoantigenic sperm protein isoform X3 n=1 Tax=Colossoma macropomum TaxID=42526 RepID=UPI00186421EB|nr:nuclear autoantigenic sperm protein isoform X3 [Colossoma macropomum]
MPEETATASAAESMEEKPCSSSAADSSVDVAEEAKKLIGTGNRHLVMGDVVSAVSVFQEACAMLAEKYGDTADECGEAFFLCGKSLLELARMENTVLGNALEGVPEESEEGEKQNDSKIESADNLDEKTRDELREQVYDAMSEDKRDSEGEVKKEEQEVKDTGDVQAQKQDSTDSCVKNEKTESSLKKGETTTESPLKSEQKANEKDTTMASPGKSEQKANEKEDTTMASPVKSEQKANEKEETTAKSPVKSEQKAAENGEMTTECSVKSDEKSENGEKTMEVEEGTAASKQGGAAADQAEKDADQDVKSTEQKGDEEKTEPMEEEGGGRNNGHAGQHWEQGREVFSSLDDKEEEEEDEEDDEGEGEDEDKESEEDEVGNLQLAWEMLEVAKVIYKRKESKEDQLMAAQIFLKLGEVGAESGNYTQALDDFQECLAIQLKHLPAHSRLLAETHYQLGTTFSYTAQYSQAIEHFNNSIKVIESRLAMLQEAIDKAEGAEEAKEEKSELEELKQLLPEIAEKIEDAKESQKTAAAASEAIHQTLGGASTSSAFPAENGGPSSSTASQIAVKPSDGASSSKAASDISHLVRKKPVNSSSSVETSA